MNDYECKTIYTYKCDINYLIRGLCIHTLILRGDATLKYIDQGDIVMPKRTGIIPF